MSKRDSENYDNRHEVLWGLLLYTPVNLAASMFATWVVNGAAPWFAFALLNCVVDLVFDVVWRKRDGVAAMSGAVGVLGVYLLLGGGA